MKVLIPMAGAGSRLQKEYNTPKPLIKIKGKSLIEHSVESLNIKDAELLFVCRHQTREIDQMLRKELSEIDEKSIIVWIDHLTRGAVETCLVPRAKESTEFQLQNLVDPEEPLLIANCDQWLKYDSEKFMERCKKNDLCVMTHTSRNPNCSFVKYDDDGKAVDVIEKVVVSDEALTGVHWYKKSKYFIETAKQILKDDFRFKNEFYLSTTYHYLLNAAVGFFSFDVYNITKEDQGLYVPIGTPEELQNFEKMEG